MKKKIIRASVYFIILLVAIMYLIPTMYTMPSIDDFDYANDMLKGPMANGDGLIVSFIKCFADLYMRWQGNYLSFFALYMSAGIGGLSTWWYRFHVAFNLILFFVSVIYMLKSLLIHDKENVEFIEFLGAFLLVVFCGLNRASPSEAFYWLNASCVYLLPFSMALLSVTNTVLYCKNRKKRNFVCGLVFAFLAAGGILMATAFINICLVVINVNELIYKKKINRETLIIFLIALAGGVVNAIAPGNFVRARGVSSEGISVVRALANTVTVMWTRMSFALRKGYLLWACIVLIMLFALTPIKKVLKTKLNPALLWIEGLIILYVTAFPVIYGYNSTEITPWRFCLVFEFLMAVIFLVCSAVTGTKISELVAGKTQNGGFKSYFLVAIIGIVLLGANYVYAGRDNMMIPVILHDEIKGDLRTFAEIEESMIYEIENSSEEDVVLNSGNPNNLILKDFNLKTDSEDSVNRDMAEYYGKKSIVIKP